MKHTLDITGGKYNPVFFSPDTEIIDLFVPHECPETMEFTLWGATFYLTEFDHSFVFPRALHQYSPPDRTSFIEKFGAQDYYLAGKAKVRISDIKTGLIRIDPYGTHRGDQMAGDPDKSYLSEPYLGKDGKWYWETYFSQTELQLQFSRDWNASGSFCDVPFYNWNCVCLWPFGSIDMRIRAEGQVTFDFDEEDLIPMETFLENPKQYACPFNPAHTAPPPHPTRSPSYKEVVAATGKNIPIHMEDIHAYVPLGTRMYNHTNDFGIKVSMRDVDHPFYTSRRRIKLERDLDEKPIRRIDMDPDTLEKMRQMVKYNGLYLIK